MKHALGILVAIVAAPGEAFAAIREQPSWIWTLAVTIFLSAAGSLIATPAARHMIEATFNAQLAADPRFAGLSPDQLHAKVAQAIAMGKAYANVAWVVAGAAVVVSVVLEAITVWAIGAFLRAKAGFTRILGLCCAAQFVAAGIGGLVFGIIVALKPEASIHTQADFLASVPSLAWFAPNAPPRIVAFLAGLGPFSLWATVLLALGLTAVAGLQRIVAWTTSIGITLLGAAFSAAFIR